MVRDFLKKLNIDLNPKDCYHCPLVERGRCYGFDEDDDRYGRLLSPNIYYNGYFTDRVSKEPDCPLPITIPVTIKKGRK